MSAWKSAPPSSSSELTAKPPRDEDSLDDELRGVGGVALGLADVLQTTHPTDGRDDLPVGSGRGSGRHRRPREPGAWRLPGRASRRAGRARRRRTSIRAGRRGSCATCCGSRAARRWPPRRSRRPIGSVVGTRLRFRLWAVAAAATMPTAVADDPQPDDPLEHRSSSSRPRSTTRTGSLPRQPPSRFCQPSSNRLEARAGPRMPGARLAVEPDAEPGAVGQGESIRRPGRQPGPHRPARSPRSRRNR